MNRRPLWTLATSIAMIAMLALVSGVMGTASVAYADGSTGAGEVGYDPPDTIPDTTGGGTNMVVQEPLEKTSDLPLALGILNLMITLM